MSADVFIYYRVQADSRAALLPQVKAMQAELANQFALSPGLKRRADVQDDIQTWMEVYTGAPAGFAAVVEQAARRYGLAALIDGARHVETFVALESCA